MIERVKLFYDNHNEKNLKVVEELCYYLFVKGFRIVEDDFSLAISIGGDGSFLHMVHTCDFNPNIYYIGIHTGTLGFAQEIDPKEISLFLDNILEEKYSVEDIGVLSSIITSFDETQYFYKALNEVVVHDKNLDTIYLDVLVNGHLLEHFVGDGVLVATSFGSTAYNRSYGGSIIYSDFSTMQITPIAPIDTKMNPVLFSPVVLPAEKCIQFSPRHRTHDIMFSVDGKNYLYDDIKEISVTSDQKIKVLRMHDYDYTQRIYEKFL